MCNTGQARQKATSVELRDLAMICFIALQLHNAICNTPFLQLVIRANQTFPTSVGMEMEMLNMILVHKCLPILLLHCDFMGLPIETHGSGLQPLGCT